MGSNNMRTLSMRIVTYLIEYLGEFEFIFETMTAWYFHGTLAYVMYIYGIYFYGINFYGTYFCKVK